MKPPQERLEHLITRCLDDAATPEEQALLREWRRRDPDVRALYDQHRALDEALRETLRCALGRPAHVPRQRSRWFEAARAAMVAAAACVAMFAWMRPNPTGNAPTARCTQQAGALTSWFAPTAATEADRVVPVRDEYERPKFPVRRTAREWIVIPGEQPGTFFVVEAEHVRTRTVPVYRDY